MVNNDKTISMVDKNNAALSANMSETTSRFFKVEGTAKVLGWHRQIGH